MVNVGGIDVCWTSVQFYVHFLHFSAMRAEPHLLGGVASVPPEKSI